MKKIKIENGYIKENVAPLQNYAANYINLIKKVIKVKEGKEETEYLERNKNGYDTSSLKKMDIIKAVRFDKINHSAEYFYYLVIKKTESELTVEKYSTYNKAVEARDNLIKDIKQLKSLIDKYRSILNFSALIA